MYSANVRYLHVSWAFCWYLKRSFELWVGGIWQDEGLALPPESVPAGKGKKRMDLAVFTATASPLLLPPYVRFVPANRYDWCKFRNALYLKYSTYGMGGTCTMNGGEKKRCTILAGKPERKRPLWSPRRRWGNNIKDNPTKVKLRTLTGCFCYVNKRWAQMKGKNNTSEWKNLSEI